MAFNVEFYRFSKKPNSTKIPANSDLILTAPCVLLDGNSIISPRISIRAEENVTLSNYARVVAFRRYYFITDWTFINGLWVASLAVDVLSSYKAAIGNSEQYILRSSSNYDGNIVDVLYPAKTAPTYSRVTLEDPSGDFTGWATKFENGVYIVGILNDDQTSVGATTYYCMTHTDFANFRNLLLSSADWLMTGIDDVSEGVMKALFNPLQYVVSCKWFPISNAQISKDGLLGSAEKIKFGWWETEQYATPLKDVLLSFYLRANVPKHPQTSRGGYMNTAPFTRLAVEVPSLGVVPIDPALFSNKESAILRLNIDLVSGNMLAGFITPQYPAVWESTLAVPVNLAQVTSDYMGVARSAFGAVDSVATNLLRGDVSGAISSVASGVMNAIDCALPQVATLGGNGSVAAVFSQTARLYATFYEAVAEDVDHRGKPLCKTVKINTLNGYIMASDAHIEIGGSIEEANRIINYMNGGFYYE